MLDPTIEEEEVNVDTLNLWTEHCIQFDTDKFPVSGVATIDIRKHLCKISR